MFFVYVDETLVAMQYFLVYQLFILKPLVQLLGSCDYEVCKH